MSKEILLEGDPNQWSVAITRQTITRILGSEDKNKGDMLALWMFYAYTARWQHVNQAKATTAYTAKGLGWTEERERKSKKELITMGLIQDAVRKDESGKAVGWFIRVFHLASHTPLFPECGKSGDKCSRNGNLNAQGMEKTKATSFPTEKPVGGSFQKNPIPSEDEFEAYIESERLDNIANGRPSLYSDMIESGWKDGRGKRISDWRAYLRGLEQKMETAKER